MTDAEDDERRLVEAAQRNPSEFAALYERHFERVYAFVVRRVRDRDVAEDVTADVFHKALSHLGRFEWRGAPFGAWLIRIAANSVADRSRRGAREVADADRLAAEASIDAEADRFEDHATLFRYVDELPPIQRAVIVERFAHERSIRDVAARLQKSEGAIKQLQWRALKTLRQRIHPTAHKPRGGDPGEGGHA
jgi:RNA polymerase sigma-70 factor, ECF subfamily